jgi:F-type H+-transporting ATPase subunit delta
MPEFIHADGAQKTVFDVDAERLSRVYAQAGLDAAGDVSAQESLVGELESIVSDVLQRHARIGEVFASELIREDDKLAMLDRVFGGRVSQTTLNFLKVIARHKRLGVLRDIARSARLIWQQRAGRVPVQLETANQLDPALEQEILRSFGKALGADPIVTARINPDLIAGFVLRVGDRVFDASIRTQLEHMRHAMIDRAVEAIQRGPQRFFNNGEVATKSPNQVTAS